MCPGLVAFLAPGLTRFKEWAYARFSVAILAAYYSHFSSGQTPLALDPLVTLVVLVIFYFTRFDVIVINEVVRVAWPFRNAMGEMAASECSRPTRATSAVSAGLIDVQGERGPAIARSKALSCCGVLRQIYETEIQVRN